jgi:hypothetical protein
MLNRNTTLLSDDFRKLTVAPFRATVMTPIAIVRGGRIVNGCDVAGCRAETAKYFRCSKCCLARYCGAEHQKQHWQEHKAVCVPYMQRPHLAVKDDNMRNFQASHYFYEPLQRSTLDIAPLLRNDGVWVVHLKVTEPRALVYVSDLSDTFSVELKMESLGRDGFGLLLNFVRTSGQEFVNGVGYVYCDADFSEEGMVRIFTDKTYNCTL